MKSFWWGTHVPNVTAGSLLMHLLWNIHFSGGLHLWHSNELVTWDAVMTRKEKVRAEVHLQFSQSSTPAVLPSLKIGLNMMSENWNQ